MKISKIIAEILILIVATAAAYAQQTLTQTVTAQNKNCNATCSVIDVPELNGNPSAVIFITPVGNTPNLNPHAVAAYFMYLKKWSVFNLDGTAITEGANYKIEYYAGPDANHFVYVAADGGGACIDHAGLNGNSKAEVRIFPTSSPGRGGLFNKSAVRVDYNPKNQRWCLSSVTDTGVTANTAYNIQFSGGSVALALAPSGPVGTPVQIIPDLPVSTLTPGPPAPLTVIAREVLTFPTTELNFVIQFPYPDRTAPCTVLSYVNAQVRITDSVILTNVSAVWGSNDNLVWTTQIADGGVSVTVCTIGTSVAKLTGGKVNILVLR